MTEDGQITHVMSPLLPVHWRIGTDVTLKEDISSFFDFLRIQEIGQLDADLRQICKVRVLPSVYISVTSAWADSVGSAAGH